MNQASKNKDIAFLACFIALITLQPFFLHHEIIMMETGIHLPALNALFHGAVPYRDFFFLRGPLDLYVPAALMFFLGKTSAVLPLFYYVWTVATLLVLLLIAKEFYRTRLILYVMIPVLIARTFPRVSYYYWGGMRYCLGLLSLWCIIFFFKKQKWPWVFFSGVFSALSLLTTVEAGFCSIAAVSAIFIFSSIFRIHERRIVFKAALIYIAGIFMILFPYALYLISTSSLIPLLETHMAVITKMTSTFVDAKDTHPNSFFGYLAALWPGHRFFEMMTPAYSYIIFLFYLFWRIKRKNLNKEVVALTGVAIYGIALYILAFRKIHGHHFEMALQPEKIILFFMIEECYLFLRDHKNSFSLKLMKNLHVSAVGIFVFIFIGSSFGYAFARYNHRFPVFKMARNALAGKQEDLSLLRGEEKRPLNIERGKGMVVPVWQAEEIEGVVNFLKGNTTPDEPIFSFPEVGNFSFWADRPFVGRFPIATAAWIDERWYQEILRDFKLAKPKFVVMTHPGHRTFPETWYFRNPKNKRYFQEFTDLILANYNLKESYSSVGIYQLK